MKLKALFDKLAKKAGIDGTDEYKAITVPDVDIDDATAAGMEKGLMNLEAAKAHPDIKKHIRTETLNGVDQRVADILGEEGYGEDDDAKTILGEKNSFEKIAKLTALIKTKEAAKAKSGSKVDKDGYDAQIKTLTAAVKAEKDARLADQQKYTADNDQQLTDFELTSILMGKNYSLPKTMGTKLKLTTAKGAVNEQLQKLGFKITRDENGNIQIVDKDGKPALDLKTNDLIEPGNFIDGALAQNSLLQITDPANPGGDNIPTKTVGADQIKAPANFQAGAAQLDAMIAGALKA